MKEKPGPWFWAFYQGLTRRFSGPYTPGRVSIFCGGPRACCTPRIAATLAAFDFCGWENNA